MPYQLRPATEDDYDFLYHLHVATIKDYVSATWGWDDAYQQAHFRERFDPAKRQIIQSDGRDVGVLVVEEREEELFLGLIEVLPDYQGRGLGTAVIGDVLAQARGRPVALHVLKVNPARRLYERLGFRVTNETESHFEMRSG